MSRHRTFKLSQLIIVIALLFATPMALGQTRELPTVYFFWGDGCPYCSLEQEYLELIQQRYPDLEIQSYEVWYSTDHRDLMVRMVTERGSEVRGVPVTVIEDQVFTGFNQNIAVGIELALRNHMPDQDAAAQGTSQSPAPDPPDDSELTITLPLLGPVDLSSTSLTLSTLLIAFVDGLNPCSLWVLSLLLALVLHSHSRRKILLVGITFLTVTSLVYGGFIAGLFGAFQFVSLAPWLRVFVAAVALLAALINIKDFYAFKQGFSLTLSDRHKPRLYERMRGVLQSDRPIKTVGLTAALAFAVSVIELPCTAGLPILWTNLLTQSHVGPAGFGALLGLYLVVFILDELALFLAALVTMRATRINEQQGRSLKLLSGVVMFCLGAVLLIHPNLMTTLSGTLVVFAVATLVTILLLITDRFRRGGTEK